MLSEFVPGILGFAIVRLAAVVGSIGSFLSAHEHLFPVRHWHDEDSAIRACQNSTLVEAVVSIPVLSTLLLREWPSSPHSHLT